TSNRQGGSVDIVSGRGPVVSGEPYGPDLVGMGGDTGTSGLVLKGIPPQGCNCTWGIDTGTNSGNGGDFRLTIHAAVLGGAFNGNSSIKTISDLAGGNIDVRVRGPIVS